MRDSVPRYGLQIPCWDQRRARDDRPFRRQTVRVYPRVPAARKYAGPFTLCPVDPDRSVSVGFHPRVAAGGPRLPIGRFRHVGRPRAPRACALLFTCPRLQQSREAATAGASHVTLRQRRSAPRERRSGRDRRGGKHASPGGCRAPRHVSTVCVRSHSHRCSAFGASDVPPPSGPRTWITGRTTLFVVCSTAPLPEIRFPHQTDTRKQAIVRVALVIFFY
jgi:hypothetical protein